MEKKNNLLLYHDLIASIVETMEARDSYTGAHSFRVAKMTERICELLSLSEDEITLIHIAAHIHDIGKIGIEDVVLRKEGALTEEEWEQIKQHPVIGDRILSKIDSFCEIADIVRHHHERWNGRGYPDALQGEDIPFGSRIIAVADSIDAMMTDRSYRRRMSSEECREEVVRNTGIMYDAQITRLVLKHWEEIVGYLNVGDT